MANTPVGVKKTAPTPAPVGAPDAWRPFRTEDDAAYKVMAELPGMNEKEIEVVVSSDMQTLKGEKRQEKEQKEENFYLSERSYGSVQRSFYVPEGVDRDKIAADFSKGVLTITVPKTAKAVEQQKKKIEVKSAA